MPLVHMHYETILAIVNKHFLYINVTLHSLKFSDYFYEMSLKTSSRLSILLALFHKEHEFYKG